MTSSAEPLAVGAGHRGHNRAVQAVMALMVTRPLWVAKVGAVAGAMLTQTTQRDPGDVADLGVFRGVARAVVEV